jgi:transposase
MKPLSSDLRARIVAVYTEGEQSYSQVAKRFHVSRSSVKRFVKQWRETGCLEPKPVRNGSQPVLEAAGLALLNSLLERQGEVSQDELREQVATQTGILVSQPTICRTLQRVRITRKKDETSRRTGTGRCQSGATGVCA